MKRIILFLLTVAWTIFLAACSQAAGSESTAPSSLEEEIVPVTQEENISEAPSEEQALMAAETSGSNILVAYFTWAENTVFLEGDGEVDAIVSPSVVVPGNVQQLAGWVQEKTGGDLFSIRVTDPYPSDWDACLERANEERGDNARPELQENVDDLDQYDTVFLGYPNWWYGVPMAVLSFLEQNDLSGKDVYLFCSHGTGGLANSVEMITEAAPNARISDDIFDCYEEEASYSQKNIQAWVESLGFSGSDSLDVKEEASMTQITVTWGENQILCELNDSPAAHSLLIQLPMTIEVEDYSTNEKIFYPLTPLDTTGSPLAQAGAGTLAYYEPWGDVVFFYGDYNENPGLFELGQVVSGIDMISKMSGTITIETVE